MKKQNWFSAGLAMLALTVSMFFIVPAAPADDNETLLTGMKITPSVLNMKSRGKFVTAHINLPEEYDLPDAQDVMLVFAIDDNTTAEIPALRTTWDFNGNLTVKFSRSQLQGIISDYIEELPALVPLSVTIAVDNETLLYGDDIRVKKPGKSGKGGGKDDKGGNGNGNGNGNGRGGKK